MISIDDIRAARERTSDAIRTTPLFSSERMGARLGVRLLLKAELLQKTGSFKPRGALNRLRAATAEERARGVVTVSAGNHAQAVAWAAAETGTHAVVCMLASASPTKVAATRGYGAEVILVEGGGSAAFDHAEALQRERGLTMIHPFEDPLVVAGHGTMGLELLDQIPELDVLVCPVGGGGLISGTALAIKALRPAVRIYGVEPEGASALRQSWDSGRVVRLSEVQTIADGLAAPMAGELPLELTRRFVDDIVLVSDEEIAAGTRAVMAYAKLFPEPAGGAATGALLAGKIPVRPGETVVSVLSGGNHDLDKLAAMLARFGTAI